MFTIPNSENLCVFPNRNRFNHYPKRVHNNYCISIVIKHLKISTNYLHVRIQRGSSFRLIEFSIPMSRISIECDASVSFRYVFPVWRRGLWFWILNRYTFVASPRQILHPKFYIRCLHCVILHSKFYIRIFTSWFRLFCYLVHSVIIPLTNWIYAQVFEIILTLLFSHVCDRYARML